MAILSTFTNGPSRLDDLWPATSGATVAAVAASAADTYEIQLSNGLTLQYRGSGFVYAGSPPRPTAGTYAEIHLFDASLNPLASLTGLDAPLADIFDGDPRLAALAGADFLNGGNGADALAGGAGDDRLFGNAGDDVLAGEGGNDTLNGGGGDDTLSGGADDDVVTDLDGSSASIDGGAGDDRITIGLLPLASTIAGGDGIDVLVGGGVLSNHVLSGLEILETNGGTITARAAQFEGFDTIRTRADQPGASVALALGPTGAAATLDLSDELSSGGGPRALSLTGSSDAESLTAGSGNDTVNGGGGDDVVFGGAGLDLLFGSTGNDVLDGGDGDDNLIGDSGNDTLIGGEGDDGLTDLSGELFAPATSMDGGAGDDRFAVNGMRFLSGSILGGSGVDSLQVGVSFGPGDVSLLSISGVEVLQTLGNHGAIATAAQFEGFDTIRTTPFTGTTRLVLTVAATGAATTLDLADELNGGEGGPRAVDLAESADDETIVTGEGADTLRGGGGSDALDGGRGDDLLIDLSGASATLNGGPGNDRLEIATVASGAVIGGSGTDVLFAPVDLRGLSISTVEILEIGVGTATGTASQFEGFNTIRDSLGRPNDAVRLTLAATGGPTVLDLAGELGSGGGLRAVDLLGSSDDESLTGGGAGDSLNGGAGDDTLAGGAGLDRLEGGAGDDRLRGGSGGDVLSGGDDDDALDGEGDDDELRGGAGNDGLAGGGGNDTLFGGDGVDTADYGAASRGVAVDLRLTVAQAVGGGLGSDLIEGVENLAGGGGNDSLAGEDGANDIAGAGGNDRLFGFGGSDALRGGAGADTLDGGTGHDALFGGAGDDVYEVDASGDVVREDAVPGLDDGGNDLVRSSAASFALGAFVERLTLMGSGDIAGAGGEGANVLTGNAGANLLDGGGGADTLLGGAGADTLIGGAGADRLFGGTGADVLDGGEGSDAYFIDASDVVTDTGATPGDEDRVVTNGSYVQAEGDGVEAVEVAAGSGAATLTGNASGNALTGNEAKSTLFGLGGNDTLNGGAGADRLEGGTGVDRLIGGADEDVFAFANGDAGATATTFDVVVDFATGLDAIDLPFAVADGAYAETALAGGNFAAVKAAADALMASGTRKAVFVAVTTTGGDGFLFWDTDGVLTTSESAIRLAGLNDLAAFDRTDLI